MDGMWRTFSVCIQESTRAFSLQILVSSLMQLTWDDLLWPNVSLSTTAISYFIGHLGLNLSQRVSAMWGCSVLSYSFCPVTYSPLETCLSIPMWMYYTYELSYHTSISCQHLISASLPSPFPSSTACLFLVVHKGLDPRWHCPVHYRLVTAPLDIQSSSSLTSKTVPDLRFL